MIYNNKLDIEKKDSMLTYKKSIKYLHLVV